MEFIQTYIKPLSSHGSVFLLGDQIVVDGLYGEKHDQLEVHCQCLEFVDCRNNLCSGDVLIACSFIE